MTPERLTMHGFACYREKTVINFADLDTALFAIAGPTGSGKSVILDAITFALYGQTARLGSRGVMETLASPGAESMTVQFLFAAGRQRYRVTRVVNVARASGPAQELRIDRWTDGAWAQLPESDRIRDANAALARIVGLDYDGFTRAVLLPQGAFDEFLRGDPGKRRKVLTNLLNLDRLTDMAQAANATAKEAKARVASLTDRLEEDYADASEEHLAAVEAQIKEAAEHADRARAQRDVTTRWLGFHQALRDATARLQDARARMAAAAPKVSEEQYQRHLAASAFRAPLDRLDQATRRANEAQTAALDARAALEREREAEQALVSDKERADQEVAQALQALAEFTESFADLQREHAILQEHPAPSDAPPGEWSWEAWREVERDEAQHAERERALSSARVARHASDRAKASLDSAEAALANAVEIRGRTEKRLKRLRASEAEARASVEKLARENLVAEITHGLAPGDPCPVCSAALMTIPTGHAHEALAAAKELLKTATYQAEEAGEALAKTNANVSSLMARVEERREHLESAEEHARAQEAVLSEHGLTLDSKLDASAILDRRDSLLAALDQRLTGILRGTPPSERRQALQGQAERATERAKSSDRALAQHHASIAALGATLEAADRDSERATKEYSAALDALDRTGAPFESLSDVLDALLPEDDMRALTREREAYLEQHREAQDDERRALQELQGSEFDPEALERAERAAAAASDDAERAVAAVGSLQAEHERLRKAIIRADDLREMLRAARAREEAFTTLGQELRSDRFPEFLLARAQDYLANHASYMLGNITGGRYRLLLEDGEYRVLDAWGSDTTRSVRTLSGGETFITSLALALALSETLAGNAELGALFLDEGFGTLDAETLDAVATSLETLSQDGRMVGLVTHVEALVERMPARLRITKTPAGSTAAWDA